MGTCLKDTFNFLFYRQDKDDYTIIHAMVERHFDKLRHPHSVLYNKKTGNIHEVSNSFKKKNVVVPFLLWVMEGKVSNIVQYSFEEYRQNLLKTKAWDFWDLKNRKGVVFPTEERW
jgi:hypothetical protein